MTIPNPIVVVTMQRAIPIAAAVLAGALGLLDFVRNIELQTYDLRVAATARPVRARRQRRPDRDRRREHPPDGAAGRALAVAAAGPRHRDRLPRGRRRKGDRLRRAVCRARHPQVHGRRHRMDRRGVGCGAVESTRKAGNVVHIAEASSARADRSRRGRSTETSTRPRSTCALPDVGCVEPRPRADAAVSGAGRWRRAAIGHSLFTSTPTARCAACRRSCRVGERSIPSFALATTLATGATPSIARAHR